MEKSLNEKVILISGEVSNLSMGVIHSFLKEKAIVIFPAKSLRQIDMIKAYRDINQYDNFITLLIDVRDFDQVTETCETITEKFSKIDISIAFPEFSSFKKDLTKASLDEWNNMIETDMAPFFMGARVVLDLMKENPGAMFVHISDSRLFENINSCALARVAFTTRMEMSRIFAEEAYRDGIRYYHLWAGSLPFEGTLKSRISLPASAETISLKIVDLYQKETYDTNTAIQSFPEQMLHQ